MNEVSAQVAPPPPRVHPLLSCFVFLMLWQIAAGMTGIIPYAVLAALHWDTVVHVLRSPSPERSIDTLLSGLGDVAMLASALAAIPTYGVVALCRKWMDKAPMADIGLAPDGRALLRGFGAGVAAVGAIFAVLVAAGAVRVAGLAPGAPFARVAGLLPLVLLQSGAEEVVCRGYLMRTLMGRYRPVTSVLVVSLLFGALHLLNPGASLVGFVSTTLIGVLFSLVTLQTNGLWTAIGLHTAWNFTLGTLASLPVSGLSLSHLLDIQVSGPRWLLGGAYGIEASLLTLVLIVVACVVLWRRPLKLRQPSTR